MRHLGKRSGKGRLRGRDGGLTLIELMLVVALVAILVSLAASGWSGWRDKVRTKQAQDDIIALSVVIDQYWDATGAFPSGLAAVGRGGMRDPWGRPYVYLVLDTPRSRGAARKDHSLVPLNSDYDLYSKGADGMSAPALTAASSKDDILRASNGRFIGRASTY